METLKSSKMAKILAAVLLVVFTMLLGVSFLGMIALDDYGIYQRSKEEILKERYRQICEDYSITAMAGYKEDFNRKELSRTNYRYGVIKADSVDLNNPPKADEYLVRNFEALPEEVVISEYDIGEDAEFIYGKNIWDSFYITSNEQYDYVDMEHPLEGYYYDRYTESFYLLSDKQLFQIRDGGIYEQDGTTFSIDNINNSYLLEREVEVTENGKSGIVYDWYDELSDAFLDNGAGTFIELSQIEIVDKVKLARIGKISEEEIKTYDDHVIYTSLRKEPKTEHYIVLSCVHEPLGGAQSFGEGDMFVQSKILIDFMYRMCYPAIVIFVISLGGFVITFSFLMAAAGHQKGKQKIYPGIMDKIPLDLYLAGIFCLEFAFVAIVTICLQEVSYRFQTFGSGGVTSIVISVCAIVLGILLVVVYCMSFAVRIKMGKWWRSTCVYWICRKCMKLISGIVSFCLRVMANLLRSMTMLWKAWLVLLLLAFVELIAFNGSFRYYYDFPIMFWLAEKIVLYPIIIIQLLQMNKLQKGAQRIANGEMNYRIDTSHMFWEIKKHGEYLNDIRMGMNYAVNERMKSERFKTELITNVSHDIKTPLTSIINYVDLLQKEQIDNPVVQEYLEVLHRQSARLKKLIEDLMEASKASSGSLSVVMEKCDTGVMLIQTVGEFEEKLMENQIELKIKKPEEEIFIEADNRHLWRVFDNLMNNICKYAQPLTRAYINLEQDEDSEQAVITFRNISKCQLNISSEELMERFVRGDSSRNTEGSGLGISIAKSLTELMNGKFELIVDGDLFKVVLLFPLYGSRPAEQEQKEQNEKKRLEDVAQGLQNAGVQAVEISRGILDKTGQTFYRAGRFVRYVKQAAQQVKEEDARKEDDNG